MTARVILAAALLLACGAAGCNRGKESEAPVSQHRQDPSSPVTTAEMRVDPVATAEPGVDRHQWRATTDGARALVGNLTASLEGGRGGQLVLAFASGATLKLERVADHFGADRVGDGGATFASTLSTDPNAGVFVYRVVEEKLANAAAQGGLCQQAKTSYVAISEFVNRSGEWVLDLASYKGATQPGPQAQAAPQLCNALGYEVN